MHNRWEKKNALGKATPLVIVTDIGPEAMQPVRFLWPADYFALPIEAMLHKLIHLRHRSAGRG